MKITVKRFPKAWKELKERVERKSWKPEEELEIEGWAVTILTKALLRSARILRIVLKTWEDCCLSDYCERSLANVGVKNLQGIIMHLEWSTKDWKGDQNSWWMEEELRTFRRQQCWDQSEYSGESLIIVETCCHSDSSESLPANASMKNSQYVKWK